MPNIFAVRDPSKISPSIWDKILLRIPDAIVDQMNTQGGLKKEHVRLLPIEAYKGQTYEHEVSLIILTKKTPDYLEKQQDLAVALANGLKEDLVKHQLLQQHEAIKVNLILVDSTTAMA